MSETLRDMIKRHEGYRERVYLDSLGFPTVGYGHCLSPGSCITGQIAELLLDMDLAEVELDFAKLSFARRSALNPARTMVIKDMLFNLGFPRVLQFRAMWDAIERGDFEAAAKEMLDSKWARQVGARATELAAIMRTGVCDAMAQGSQL